MMLFLPDPPHVAAVKMVTLGLLLVIGILAAMVAILAAMIERLKRAGRRG